MLAVSVAWDTALHRSFEAAVKMASETLNQVMTPSIWIFLVIKFRLKSFMVSDFRIGFRMKFSLFKLFGF